MENDYIAKLCRKCFSKEPTAITRCETGIGNYVFRVACGSETYIFRCSDIPNAYQDTAIWLRKLEAIHIPVPTVYDQGRFQGFDYLILSYLEGADIGQVYPQLTDGEKRKIAKEIVHIQQKVALLEIEDPASDWSWHSFVQYMLDRAKARITANGHFDPEKVERLRKQSVLLGKYFSTVKPTAYLDDISSKNLIIHNGCIRGIVDIDWMGMGDVLTYVALTNMAFLDLGYDTAYVAYILEEMRLSQEQNRAFLFYSLLYCVDFMGERGMTFLGKTIPVDQQIIDKLNGIYDALWEQWRKMDA